MHRGDELEELSSWDNPPPMHLATFRKAFRNAWKRAFGNICQWESCGVLMHFEARFRHLNSYATVDHIISRGLGGTNHLKNMQVICKKCNNDKSKKEII